MIDKNDPQGEATMYYRCVALAPALEAAKKRWATANVNNSIMHSNSNSNVAASAMRGTHNGGGRSVRWDDPDFDKSQSVAASSMDGDEDDGKHVRRKSFTQLFRRSQSGRKIVAAKDLTGGADSPANGGGGSRTFNLQRNPTGIAGGPPEGGISQRPPSPVPLAREKSDFGEVARQAMLKHGVGSKEGSATDKARASTTGTPTQQPVVTPRIETVRSSNGEALYSPDVDSTAGIGCLGGSRSATPESTKKKRWSLFRRKDSMNGSAPGSPLKTATSLPAPDVKKGR